ncbi:MAG: transcription elongation factor GreA [Proteobacteria bacterium]|nr:transcription elongation factor GreA [Pseudomonadota bacterium]
MDKVPMTKRGYVKLQEELKQLRNIERPAIIQAIATAREHGDLSENAEYHAAKEKQSFIEGRVREIEYKVSRAQVIDIKELTGDDIKFGATVLLADADTDEESTFQIVGVDESDVTEGLLSVTSPLARALIGKSEGDSVDVSTPSGGKSYEVVSVRYG